MNDPAARARGIAANLRTIASTIPDNHLHPTEKEELRNAARLLEGDLAEAIADDLEALRTNEKSAVARGFWNAAAGHVRAVHGRAT